jgi:hypothetical protein
MYLPNALELIPKEPLVFAELDEGPDFLHLSVAIGFETSQVVQDRMLI